MRHATTVLLLIFGLVPRPASAAPPPSMDDLVDAGGITWTAAGHVQGWAVLDHVGTRREGSVICHLSRFRKSDGILEKKPYALLTGRIRDGRPQVGRKGLRWFVPMRTRVASTRPIGRDLAKCYVLDAGGAAISDVFRDDFWLRPPKVPDIAITQQVRAASCRSRLPPNSAERVCLRLGHHVEHLPRTLEVGLECVIEGRGGPRTVSVVKSLDDLMDIEVTLPMLSAGRYGVRCITESAGHVAESDETNNEASTELTISRPIDRTAIGVRFGKAGSVSVHRWRSRGHENPMAHEEARLEVQLINLSPITLESVEVTCRADDLVLRGAGTLRHGEQAQVVTLGGPVVPGEHSVACEAKIALPRLDEKTDARASFEIVVTDP